MNESANMLVSWVLATEFVRRHPAYRIVEAHPGGGSYDCLMLNGPDGSTQWDINRGGSIHVHAVAGGMVSREGWLTWTLAEGTATVLAWVEQQLRLPAPAKLPASTPAVLAYRTACAFLRANALGAKAADCRMGFEDTSGLGGGRRQAWLSAFPTAAEHLRSLPHPWDPAFRLWFLLRDGKPVAAVSDDGQWFPQAGGSSDLMAAYDKAGRRVMPMLASLAPGLLP